jgi:hypothetical protein
MRNVRARKFFPMSHRNLHRGITTSNHVRLGAPWNSFPSRDSHVPSQYLLRGNEASIPHLCRKFPGSVAPILFHLPHRTIARVFESLPPPWISETFTKHAEIKCGIDPASLRKRLPRWSSTGDIKKARYCMTELSKLLCLHRSFIPENQMTQVLHSAGSLREAGLITAPMATDILRIVLPMCLDKVSLSRNDVFRILYALNRVPISPEDAIIYPIVSNFATWYLTRNRINRMKRLRSSKIHQQVEGFISS